MRREIYLLPQKFSVLFTVQYFSNHKYFVYDQYDRDVISKVTDDKWFNTHLHNS